MAPMELISLVLITLLVLLAFKFLSFLLEYFYPSEIDWQRKYNSSGNCFAIITGSTDGIGKAFAREFAARGFNILLISRSEDKLNSVAQEIRKEQF